MRLYSGYKTLDAHNIEYRGSKKYTEKIRHGKAKYIMLIINNIIYRNFIYIFASLL
ncbi:hypothetical protein LMORI2_02730 [Limnohabitans sp. MORI2]|nr:hypothetical protein LMORI2_02730 [Limnohabitans sp. MORI2]